MKVKVIMVPRSQVKCIQADDTIEDALKLIDENGLLSLPVVEGAKLFGVLSKRYVFEQYFLDPEIDRSEFLKRSVREFIKTKLTTISQDASIEEAASLFLDSKVPFVPVLNDKEDLAGIITYQKIFREYQKLYGTQEYHTLVLYLYDSKGSLAKMAEIIAKSGGNIKNIVCRDTEKLGFYEDTMKIECQDLDRVVRELRRYGYDVRVVIPAHQNGEKEVSYL